MIAKLLRQDPALRSLPIWLVIGPITLSTVLSVVALNGAINAARAQLPPESWSISNFTTWACLLWIAIVPYLFAPAVRQRSTRLAMTLPMSTRSLWLAHIAAVLIGVALVFIVVLGFVRLMGWLILNLLQGRDLFQPDILRLAVFLGAGLVLAVVLLQVPKPKLQLISINMSYFLYSTVVLVGTLGMTLVLSRLPITTALLPLAAAAIVASWVYQSLPGTFALTSLDAAAAPRHEQREATVRPSRGASYKGFLQWTLWRCFYGRWLQWWWFAAPFLIGMGVLLRGVTWVDDSDLYYLRFTLVPITVYIFLAFLSLPLRNLYRVEPLPIPRRLIFFVIFVPNLLFLSLGYGAGKIGGGMANPRENLAYRLDSDSHHYLYVPVRIDEIAWDGRVPLNTAPWGESHEAWSTPICKGCRASIYSPYHTPIGSTLDFVALQISRASGALYSEAIAPEVIKELYLDKDEEGKVVLKGEALTLRADFPHLKPRGKGPLFPVILALVVVPYALLMAVYLASFRATISDGARKVLLFGMLFIILALHSAQFALFINDFTKVWILTGTFEILVRNVMDGFAGGTLAIWVVCGLLIFSAYVFAESRFRRIETPPQPKLMAIEVLFSN